MHIPLILIVVIAWFVWRHIDASRKREEQLRLGQVMLLAELMEKDEALAKNSISGTYRERQKSDSFKSSTVLEGIVGYIAYNWHVVETYKNGVLDGEQVDYYPTGQPYRQDYYVMGKHHGYTKAYARNGQLLVDMNFENDLQEGAEKRYHENGVLSSEAFYSHAKKEGLEKSYDENGRLKIEAFFKNGKLEGPTKRYHENGKLKSEKIYKNDELVEIVAEYDENGNLKRA